MKIIKSTELSVRLKQLIRARGINQKELAKEIGVSGAAVSGWMKGAVLSSDKVSALAQYFEMSIDELLTGQKTNYSERRKTTETAVKDAIANAESVDAPQNVKELVFNYKMAVSQMTRTSEELNRERKKRQAVMVKMMKIQDQLSELINELGKEVV